MESKATLLSVLLLVFVSVCLATDPKDICPPSDLIKPCYCEKFCVFCHVSLKCKELLNQDVLTDVVRKSNDYQYGTFELRDSSVQYVPASLFSIQKIESLYIFTSSMVSWFDKAPQVDYDLDVLHLNRVRMTRRIQFDLFSGMKSLKRLSIMHTTVRRLDDNFINNIPKNLKQLVVYNCSLSRLDDNILTLFTQLESVEIDFGKIKELKRSMFPARPDHLKLISFSRQKLDNLPGDLFSNMPALKELKLVGNLIGEMSKDTFASIVPRLTTFKIHDNPIKCGCSIHWITSIDRSKWRGPWFTGDCKSPKELAGKELKDLNNSHFQHCRE